MEESKTVEEDEEEGVPDAPKEPTDAEEAAPVVDEEPEEAAPRSEHAGIIQDLDRLMCVYYNDRVANELMDLIQGQDVLLVGCEDGYVLSTLALSGHNVVALDFDAANIRKCLKLLRGWSQIRIVKLEGRSFPFDDQSFDTALVSLFAHHASNPKRVFQEVHRVLRPEGVVVIADLLKHEETWMMDELSDVWLGFTEDEVGTWLTEAGLENVKAHPTEERCSGEVFEEHKANVNILIVTANRPA